jgi:hypothetical protein
MTLDSTSDKLAGLAGGNDEPRVLQPHSSDERSIMQDHEINTDRRSTMREDNGTQV